MHFLYQSIMRKNLLKTKTQRAVKRVSPGRRAARSSPEVPALLCTPQLILLSQQKGVKLKLNLNLDLIYVALVCTGKFTRAKHKNKRVLNQ